MQAKWAIWAIVVAVSFTAGVVSKDFLDFRSEQRKLTTAAVERTTRLSGELTPVLEKFARSAWRRNRDGPGPPGTSPPARSCARKRQGYGSAHSRAAKRVRDLCGRRGGAAANGQSDAGRPERQPVRVGDIRLPDVGGPIQQSGRAGVSGLFPIACPALERFRATRRAWYRLAWSRHPWSRRARFGLVRLRQRFQEATPPRSNASERQRLRDATRPRRNASKMQRVRDARLIAEYGATGG